MRGASYCPAHAPYAGDWQRLAREQVAAEPCCAWCGTTADLCADHVVNGDRRHLQTLCVPCNSAKR